MNKGEIMKELLELINTLEGELDDAVNCLPEYNSNTDSRGYIDAGRNTVYELKNKLEKLNEVDIPGLKEQWMNSIT